ncbi:MAG: cytochrome P450 [Bacteroidia bacterium]|nr:cytochrome P450 [Bacteroidia bacterium]
METTFTPKPLPIVKGHWLFKNALELKEGMIEFYEKYTQEVGDIFYVDTLKEQMIILAHPDYAKHVLQDNNKNYKKSFAYDVLKLFLGNGLLTSEGDFWLKQRRLAQPAFHREKLQKLAENILSATRDFEGRMEERAAIGKPFNLAHELNALALDIVSRALFTSDISGNMDKVRKSMDVANEFAIGKIFELIPWPLWVPLASHLRFQKACSELDGVVLGIINERRKNPGQYHDLLSMLMETKDEDTGETMTDTQLRDEAMTIFLAGHETTAIALTWFFYLMSQHREVAEKIRQEVKEVCGDQELQTGQIHQLKYIRMAIDESLRMYPPAWIIGRKTLSEDVIGGYRIPKDANVIVLPYELHRHPDFWDKPEEYNPERFAPEKVKEMHKFAYFPFGGGPRQCIGNNFALMEMQIIISSMLRKFEFIPTSSKLPEKEQLVTLRMKDGLEVTVKKI